MTPVAIGQPSTSPTSPQPSLILSLKWLSSPATARHGVIAGEIGAALAVTATLFNPALVQYKWIAVALIVGAAIASRSAWSA